MLVQVQQGLWTVGCAEPFSARYLPLSRATIQHPQESVHTLQLQWMGLLPDPFAPLQECSRLLNLWWNCGKWWPCKQSLSWVRQQGARVWRCTKLSQLAQVPHLPCPHMWWSAKLGAEADHPPLHSVLGRKAVPCSWHPSHYSRLILDMVSSASWAWRHS